MKLSEKYREMLNLEYNKNADLTANRFALRCLKITIFFALVIWILNKVDIFIIDQRVTDFTLISTFSCYFLGLIVCFKCDLSKSWMKYYIMFWTVAIITCLTTTLTYHAVIAGVVPIVFTSMYPSRRIKWYTVFLMIISTFFTVFVGYYHGICDANMVLLTKETLSGYITADNTFSLNQINDNLPLTLSLFYVFPRCILYVVLAMMCANVSRIITMNTNYATEMRHMAERDQMTGAYTKSKYLSMLENDYVNEEHIGIIFWDVNYLKRANDTFGHECGDELIIAIADSIRELNNANDKTYRIGGDEFVMVMRGATEKSVIDKVNRWNAAIKKAAPIGDIPLSASYGYAWGEGKNIDQVIHDADQMMYEHKRKHHDANR